jgi:hypothetical protein
MKPIDEEVTWAIRAHQVLRFYPDDSVGYEYPASYVKTFGADYRPDPYVEEDYNRMRDHKWYMSVRMITVHPTRPLAPVIQPRGEGLTTNFLDENWRPLFVRRSKPPAAALPYKPDNFDEMTWIAERLAEGFEFCRIDLYSIGGRIYFGEITQLRLDRTGFALVGVFVSKRGADIRVAVTGAGSNGVFRVKSFEEALKKRFSPKSIEGMTIP